MFNECLWFELHHTLIPLNIHAHAHGCTHAKNHLHPHPITYPHTLALLRTHLFPNSFFLLLFHLYGGFVLTLGRLLFFYFFIVVSPDLQLARETYTKNLIEKRDFWRGNTWSTTMIVWKLIKQTIRAHILVRVRQSILLDAPCVVRRHNLEG